MSGHYQMGYIEGHPLYCNVICGINRLGYARKYNVRILQTSTSERSEEHTSELQSRE